MIRRWLAPVCATLLAVGSIAAIIGLQQSAAAYPNAKVKLADIAATTGEVATQPLDLVSHLATPAAVAANMAAGERSAIAALTRLAQQTPSSDVRAIMPALRAEFAAANMARDVLARDPTLTRAQTLRATISLGLPVERAGATVAAAFSAAQAQYSALGSRALRISTIGSVLTIVVLLLAFLFFYRRWLAVRTTLAGLLARSRRDALTDALTGLGNRRALIEALQKRIGAASEAEPLVLALYDLDGFKGYNDTFGHLAGDALLVRAAERLNATVEGFGTAYRMGGDEFCTLTTIGPDGVEAMRERATAALLESGEAFDIDCSCGTVLVPSEAASADAALLLADRRMYEQKATGRTSASRQSADVLLKVLSEKDDDLGHHIGDVAALAQATAQRLGLGADDVRRVRLAAELHDVGKSAIPDAILNKPAALDGDEWNFMRAHTIIGERIIRAAPSLADVAELVRSSHERVDSGGYPDGIGGEAIPLGARIIAVCDAFDAMISPRPYREPVTISEALQELRNCRGTQFDARIVDAFCALISSRATGRRTDLAA